MKELQENKLSIAGPTTLWIKMADRGGRRDFADDENESRFDADNYHNLCAFAEIGLLFM